jgi:hypothetical protein
MVKALPNDPSLAHDGTSAAATHPGIRLARHEIDHRRGGIHGSRNRALPMLRLLQGLALAIVTIVLGAGIAGIAGTEGASTSLLGTAIDAAPGGDANADPAPEPRHWQAGASRPVVDLKAVEYENDDDDDDDTLHEVLDAAALAFRGVRGSPEPHLLLRGETPIVTPCFAADMGLPRGPPACRAVG